MGKSGKIIYLLLQQILNARPGSAVNLPHVNLPAGLLSRAYLQKLFLYLLLASLQGFRIYSTELASFDVAGKLVIGTFG